MMPIPAFLYPTPAGNVEIPELEGRAIDQCSRHGEQLQRMMEAEHGVAHEEVIRFGEHVVHELSRFSEGPVAFARLLGL